MGYVYLIHFSEPLVRKTGLVWHYIGYAEEVDRRLRVHVSGRGAAILAALNKKGVTYAIVRVWPGADKTFERKLKKRKKARCLCPVCRNRQMLPFTNQETYKSYKR